MYWFCSSDILGSHLEVQGNGMMFKKKKKVLSDLKVKFSGGMLGVSISVSSSTSSPVSSKAGVITLNIMSWEGYCVNIIT